jgi:predicted TIM-barrel fold metal-dependent hydrolase
MTSSPATTPKRKRRSTESEMGDRVPTIDADAHVIETDRTWDFMEEAERRFRPVSVTSSDGAAGATQREFWRIGERIIPRRFFDVARTGASIETQELLDIEARLRHMDELGVDVHVLYPTIFLRPFTTKPEVEAALYKSYNRWMADTWAKGGGRLRWAVLVPTMTMELAVRELAWAVEHGACAVFIRGGEGDRLLSDVYFHPLYAAASRLNVPLCIHAGNGSFHVQDLYGSETAVISRAKFSSLGAIHEIILSGLPATFPELRFGVIETSASWVPYLCHDLAARLARMFDRQIDNTAILRDNHIYVACQTDDDLPYVLKYAGEDQLVIGSDYGHADTSSELEALRHLKESGTLAPAVVDKILDDNARALYGL